MNPILEGYIEESEGTEIISNPQHYLVAEDQVYINKQIISEVMKRYAFVREFCFVAKRSSPTCYYLKCATENCSWIFKSSCLNNSKLFKVRKFYDTHSCPLKDRIQSKRQSTSGVLGAMLVEKYVDLKTVYTPTDIQANMLRIHGISLTYMQAWRALDASIRGWEYCRPIVVVDGTHLKSTYEGTMLIASTLDPGGHILPLTYGIVNSENDDSWLWFFENFKNAFGEREDMCFVSDRNKSIWNATAAVYPEFRHYSCIYHLWTNLLKKTYRDTEEVRTLFFSLANAYTVQEFDELMKMMDQINPKYCAYLQKANYKKWSRAHSPVKRTWTLTSNIAESLNNGILVGRRLPEVPLLEFVRKTIEAWNEKHNEEGTRINNTPSYHYRWCKEVYGMSEYMNV
ncbi:uncharacterized protein LOC125867224 [Solanum stenotomum]|uniref:uncharacterized protein LOC125867224 n=1 Tax=Solanum stenotomum TaxID=172797 RepID=UPI0020D0A5F0|nr:uncharacterized protein LOC125867224 [Solanum stenotomum]